MIEGFKAKHTNPQAALSPKQKFKNWQLAILLLLKNMVFILIDELITNENLEAVA